MFSGFEFLCFDILTLMVLWSGFVFFFLEGSCADKSSGKYAHTNFKNVFLFAVVLHPGLCVFCEIHIHTRLSLAADIACVLS